MICDRVPPIEIETTGKPPYSSWRDMPFDFDFFYSFFPEFQGSETYPQTFVAAAAKRAQFYISYCDCRELDGQTRDYARALMIAHMCVMIKKAQDALNAGPNGTAAGQIGGSGLIQSASVGGVSVSLAVPQSQDSWQFFLNQTQYGQELLMLLSSCVPAGICYNGTDDIRDYFDRDF